MEEVEYIKGVLWAINKRKFLGVVDYDDGHALVSKFRLFSSSGTQKFIADAKEMAEVSTWCEGKGGCI